MSHNLVTVRLLFSSLILLLSSTLVAAQTLADVDQIGIVYINSYLGRQSVTLFQKLIIQEQYGFIANTQQMIDPELIQKLLDAITDVKRSGGSKLCSFDIPDFTIDYEVEVTYKNGERTYLHSYCGLPWDVIVDGEAYVQYNGKILEAYNQLLSKLDSKYNGDLSAKDFYGETFYMEFGDFPDFFPMVKKTDFSELNGYQEILNDSELFAQYARGNKNTIVDLYCKFEESNLNCENITVLVEVTSQYNVIRKLEVDFEGDKIVWIRDYLEN
jgi:hypothetical protein